MVNLIIFNYYNRIKNMRLKLFLTFCGLMLILSGCNGTTTSSSNNNIYSEDTQQIRAQLAALRAEVTDMQSELRTLNGRVEETSYGTQRGSASGELDAYAARVGAMDTRLDAIEIYLMDSVAVKQGKQPFVPNAGGGLTLGPDPVYANTPNTSTNVTVSVGGPDLPEDQFYARAKSTFDAGNFDEARVMFEDFVKFYPNSRIIDSAVFWVGETYYRQNNFERAILEYQRVLDDYPNGNKVPAAIYKQGLAFIAIGDTVNGKILLEDLVKRYPDSQEARVAENRLKNM